MFYKKIRMDNCYVKIRNKNSLLGTTVELSFEDLNGKLIKRLTISKNTLNNFIELLNEFK